MKHPARRRRRRTIFVALVLALTLPTLTACVPPPVADELRRIAEHLFQKGQSTSSPVPTDSTYTGNTSFADLVVGDCVNDLKAQGYTIIDGLDVVPCSDQHDSEIYAIPTLKGPVTYPGDTGVQKLADDACHAAFAAYVGVAYENSVLNYSYYTATKDGWNLDGDHTATCIVFHDGAQTTGSLKGTAERNDTQTP